ncbi:MAG: hypothetical protein K0R55_2748 [Sporomusa sp.]|nr:hypothetical protein [Sporomusa sp.]
MEKIPLNLLKFDPQNPRLPSFLQGETSERKIIDYMLRDEGLTDLMGSLAQLGYAEAEPLLVVPDQHGCYIVVEGNRRLAALKLLSQPDLASIRRTTIQQVLEAAMNIPTNIPVIEYPNRDAILDYLGYRHITGIKEWDSMAKAKYLEQLYAKHLDTAGSKIFTVLAKMIGSRPNYVARLLTSLHLCNYANDRAYFSLPGIDENKIEFSLVTTALSYNAIVDYLGLDSADDPSLLGIKDDACKDLFNWMFVRNDQMKTRLGDSRALKELGKVVAVPEALHRFKVLGVSLSEAILYTDEPNETFTNFVIRAKDSLKSARDCFDQVSTPSDNTRELLNDIVNQSKSLLGAFSERFNSSADILQNFSPEDIVRLRALLLTSDKKASSNE